MRHFTQGAGRNTMPASPLFSVISTLCYLWVGEVYAEVLDGAVTGVDEREWKHPSVEDEAGALSVDGEAGDVFKSQSHLFGVVLVVVGDVVCFGLRPFGVEVVFSGLQFEYGFLVVPLLADDALDGVPGCCRGIFPAVGFQSHL